MYNYFLRLNRNIFSIFALALHFSVMCDSPCWRLESYWLLRYKTVDERMKANWALEHNNLKIISLDGHSNVRLSSESGGPPTYIYHR